MINFYGTREGLVEAVRALGQTLVDDAEKYVAVDPFEITDFAIRLDFPMDGAPTINIDNTFNPNKAIKRIIESIQSQRRNVDEYRIE